jgi:hypothetical protein
MCGNKRSARTATCAKSNKLDTQQGMLEEERPEQRQHLGAPQHLAPQQLQPQQQEQEQEKVGRTDKTQHAAEERQEGGCLRKASCSCPMCSGIRGNMLQFSLCGGMEVRAVGGGGVVMGAIDASSSSASETSTSLTSGLTVSLSASSSLILSTVGGGEGGVLGQEGNVSETRPQGQEEEEEEEGYEDDFHNDTPISDDSPATQASSLSPPRLGPEGSCNSSRTTLSTSCPTNYTDSMLHQVSQGTDSQKLPYSCRYIVPL